MLVDTPGFNDTYRCEKEILQEITSWLSKTYASGKQLNGIIYLHPIINTRVEGSSLLSLQIFRKLCGRRFYDHIFLCTTFWDIVNQQVGERRERDLCNSEELWGLMRRQGAGIFRLSNYHQSKDILREIANKPSMVLDVQLEVVDKGLPIESTSAGRLVDLPNADMKENLKQQKKIAQEAAAKQLAERDAARAHDLQKVQEQFEQFRRQQASLYLEQKIQNDQFQQQLREAAEMKVRAEREKKARLEQEALEQQRVQKQKETLEQEERAREERRARELALKRERWSRQDRTRRLRLTWQANIALLEMAHNWGILRARIYHIDNQTQAFMRTCDFCHRLVGFQNYYREFVLNALGPGTALQWKLGEVNGRTQNRLRGLRLRCLRRMRFRARPFPPRL